MCSVFGTNGKFDPRLPVHFVHTNQFWNVWRIQTYSMHGFEWNTLNPNNTFLLVSGLTCRKLPKRAFCDCKKTKQSIVIMPAKVAAGGNAANNSDDDEDAGDKVSCFVCACRLCHVSCRRLRASSVETESFERTASFLILWRAFILPTPCKLEDNETTFLTVCITHVYRV